MTTNAATGLYNFVQFAPLRDDADAITAADVAGYQRLGFLAVRELLDPAAVADVLDALLGVAADPNDVTIEFEKWATPGEDLLDGVRKLMRFTGADPRLEAAARSPRMLGVVRALLGAEPELYQDMALFKPPGGGREKPWHQDHAFFDVPFGTPILGVWIALDEASVDNGCMHVLPGTHREGPVVHFQRRDFQICDTEVQTHRDTVVPLPAGGALFFDGLLHHGTPDNTSTARRRALQFHYVPAGTPRVPVQQRLDVFGSEGKDARC
ncbi:hypothetical protein Lfu02_72510 [Longispora fulva]|uniref:Ectoine hydroxylase-related dioxygenase (Phytanoyl-CoA dioxygenase family) n=1 Tax=Longispora fulva TaxID=619741 RepID=A0A8J7G6M1_9ACTN|nr:phytanoyl-CoA dioxygenase family protein [Longispora fulva]MBG6133840.1 ectoine hydroxylase-related dioxygenase (phytanoyl-CoA dioxygenase family) [Longispora fulva]GIG62879.1 hypothetical protein Lfu02_72510 [Longispora fulva]